MHRPHGFTLIEIVVVIAIVSLLLAMATFATRAITIQQRFSTTVTRLATVDAALIAFVMVQKRLPCPADGRIASGQAGAGVEVPPSATGCVDETYGVVPWTTLGISETDATDGWVRRLTYRVDPALAGNLAMDMSGCDPAGSGPANAGLCLAGCAGTSAATCTAPATFLAGKGLLVRNIAGTSNIMDPATLTGAAYVVVSHGESGGGAYLNSGQLATSTTTDSGTPGEGTNYANLPVAAYYVEDALSDGPGASHFDDMLSHPTILTVISKAALGPRSH